MISFFRILFRSLVYYRRTHFTVILGTAVSTMVLTGTLIVGDSVRASLENAVHLRLGKTAYVFSGNDRYFRSELAVEVAGTLNRTVAPLLQLPGMATANGGELKVNRVEVNGINKQFQKLMPVETEFTEPGPQEALISLNLAERLNLDTGDFFLLRIEKVSIIPQNAPFVSNEENQVAVRIKVKKILGPESFGQFNLKTSQVSPCNVFLSLNYLNQIMQSADRANRLLITGDPDIAENQVRGAINEYWKTEDMSLKILPDRSRQEWEIRSERVFIDDMMVEAVETFEKTPVKILAYFANSFRNGGKETPYSFIAAADFITDQPQGIKINRWMADDLGARMGDSIEVAYYLINPSGTLTQKSEWFVVKDIVSMQGVYADPTLMPDIPGLSDAGNCREWNTGIPVDLEKIRDKDEDYWNQFRGTPKAFISYEKGKELWQNRFGSCTAIRLSSGKFTKEEIEKNLVQMLPPAKLGFTLLAAREAGLSAARGGVDFSQLFLGLSFFLLAGCVALLTLLYNLHLEKKIGEIGTFRAIGFSHRLIRNLLIWEGGMVAVPGVLLGGILAVFYNQAIFMALNSVWSEIVRTPMVREEIRMITMISGMSTGFLLSLLTVGYTIIRKKNIRPAKLQKGITPSGDPPQIRWAAWVSGITCISAIFLIFMEIFSGKHLNATAFFTAGGLGLISSLLFVFRYLFGNNHIRLGKLSLPALAMNNLHRQPARSLRIVILFALGTFIIITTGLNQKDLSTGSMNKQSGTGGFLFYGELTLPVFTDLNEKENRFQYGLETPFTVVQFRKREGDDASCLNLNRISNPRILAFDCSDLEGRFSWTKQLDVLDPDRPWESMKQTLPGGAIPAVADQTVIQWGLGKKVGDTLYYADELGGTMKLLLVGGLKNSIFQGNVLIDESHFLKHFPSSSGTHVFLAEGSMDNQEQVKLEMERAFRNSGLELQATPERLALFNEVENTYLFIFMLLGGLGMILGTVGLGISLARNILDRRRELAILKAIGFSKKSIMKVLSMEHLVLLLAGTLTGTVTALVAILPSLLSDFVEASWQTAAFIILMIFLNGWLWIFLVVRSYLRKEVIVFLRTE